MPKQSIAAVSARKFTAYFRLLPLPDYTTRAAGFLDLTDPTDHGPDNSVQLVAAAGRRTVDV